MNYSSTIKKRFEGVVGQDNAKQRLHDIILGPVYENGFMSPTLLAAPTGCGKSHLLEATKLALKDINPKRKVVWMEDGEEAGTPRSFFEDILIPYFRDKDAVLIIDEFHKVPYPIRELLRTMIPIRVDRRAVDVRRGDLSVTIDPLHHGFIFATNKVDAIDQALMDRLERIDLSLFTDEEMEKIFFNALAVDNINFHPSTLRKIAECNRGNARDLVKWSNAIRRWVAIHHHGDKKKTINRENVAEIIRIMEKYPLGVSANELSTMLALERFGPLKLKELAARNLCSSKEQNSNEKYLLNRGLITIDGERILTADGRAYLGELRKDKYIPEAAVKNITIM